MCAIFKKMRTFGMKTNFIRAINYYLLTLLISGIFAPRTEASSFDAICGTFRCTIDVSKEEIKTPYGIIPTSRVSSWGGGGKSEVDLIMGAGATYLLGPVGLLGFAAKTHDYNYALTGYNTKGNKVVVRIQFKNSKPAKKFAAEMLEFTRLGMSEARTASEIKQIEALMEDQGLSWVGDLKVGTLEQDFRRERSGNSPIINSKKCGSENLDSDPHLKDWANANPALAAKVRDQFTNCSEN